MQVLASASALAAPVRCAKLLALSLRASAPRATALASCRRAPVLSKTACQAETSEKTASVAPPPEMCVIVNERNQVVRHETRKITVSQRLRGRGAYCLVFDSNGALLVSRRTLSKDVYPGYLDCVISGVCNQGEEYEDTAVRELCEELGASERAIQSSLRRMGCFPYNDQYCHVFGCGFTVVYDGKLSLQEEEVEWARFMPLSEVKDALAKAQQPDADVQFTPVGRHVLEMWLHMHECGIGERPFSYIGDGGWEI